MRRLSLSLLLLVCFSVFAGKEIPVPVTELNLNRVILRKQGRKAVPLARIRFSVPAFGEKSFAEYRNSSSAFSSGIRCMVQPLSFQGERIHARIECQWNMPAGGPLKATSRENDLSAFSVSARSVMRKGTPKGIAVACSQDGQGAMLFCRGELKKLPSAEGKGSASGKWELLLLRSCTDEKESLSLRRTLSLFAGRGELKEESLEIRFSPKTGNCLLLELNWKEQAGQRRDGTPVREELKASLIFPEPVPGRECELLRITSFCRKDHLAFSGEPAQRSEWVLRIRPENPDTSKQ